MCKVCYVKTHNKKRCTKCYLLKSVEEFNKRTLNKDGFNHRCKPCQDITKGTGQKREKPYKKRFKAKKER